MAQQYRPCLSPGRLRFALIFYISDFFLFWHFPQTLFFIPHFLQNTNDINIYKKYSQETNIIILKLQGMCTQLQVTPLTYSVNISSPNTNDAYSASLISCVYTNTLHFIKDTLFRSITNQQPTEWNWRCCILCSLLVYKSEDYLSLRFYSVSNVVLYTAIFETDSYRCYYHHAQFHAVWAKCVQEQL